jgi:capsular polysaccharide transport system permease protein
MEHSAAKGTSLFAAFEERGRVISALIFRELKTRFGDARLGVAWVLLEPLIHLAIILSLRYVIGRLGYHPTINSQMFLITGIVPFLFFRTTITRIMKTVDANKALLVFHQIRIPDLVAARIVLEITIYIGVFTVILMLFYLMGFTDVSIKSPQDLLLVSILLWFSALSAGLFCMIMNAIFPLTEKIVSVVLRVMYLASGVIFLYEMIPYQYRIYVIYNPVLHLINMVRESFFTQIAYDATFMNAQYVFTFFGVMFASSILLIISYKKHLLQEND